jgi:hypothetical protein
VLRLFAERCKPAARLLRLLRTQQLPRVQAPPEQQCARSRRSHSQAPPVPVAPLPARPLSMPHDIDWWATRCRRSWAGRPPLGAELGRRLADAGGSSEHASGVLGSVRSGHAQTPGSLCAVQLPGLLARRGARACRSAPA